MKTVKQVPTCITSSGIFNVNPYIWISSNDIVSTLLCAIMHFYGVCYLIHLVTTFGLYEIKCPTPIANIQDT